ncbi:MAG: hypothetical protein M0P13_03310 [Fibrobacteraceae bacterium]|nr:hypothetical protein [Fibrobacteraceae bacterium]
MPLLDSHYGVLNNTIIGDFYPFILPLFSILIAFQMEKPKNRPYTNRNHILQEY